MPETSELPSLPSVLGDVAKKFVFYVQDYSLLSLQAVKNVFTPPQYWTDTLEQMDLIGVGSMPIERGSPITFLGASPPVRAPLTP